MTNEEFVRYLDTLVDIPNEDELLDESWQEFEDSDYEEDEEE